MSKLLTVTTRETVIKTEVVLVPDNLNHVDSAVNYYRHNVDQNRIIWTKCEKEDDEFHLIRARLDSRQPKGYGYVAYTIPTGAVIHQMIFEDSHTPECISADTLIGLSTCMFNGEPCEITDQFWELYLASHSPHVSNIYELADEFKANRNIIATKVHYEYEYGLKTEPPKSQMPTLIFEKLALVLNNNPTTIAVKWDEREDALRSFWDKRQFNPTIATAVWYVDGFGNALMFEVPSVKEENDDETKTHVHVGRT